MTLSISVSQQDNALPLCRVSRFIYYYAECHYAELRYAECLYAECRYAECLYTECRYAEYRSGPCSASNCGLAPRHSV